MAHSGSTASAAPTAVAIGVVLGSKHRVIVVPLTCTRVELGRLVWRAVGLPPPYQVLEWIPHVGEDGRPVPIEVDDDVFYVTDAAAQYAAMLPPKDPPTLRVTMVSREFLRRADEAFFVEHAASYPRRRELLTAAASNVPMSSNDLSDFFVAFHATPLLHDDASVEDASEARLSMRHDQSNIRAERRSAEEAEAFAKGIIDAVRNRRNQSSPSSLAAHRDRRSAATAGSTLAPSVIELGAARRRIVSPSSTTDAPMSPSMGSSSTAVARRNGVTGFYGAAPTYRTSFGAARNLSPPRPVGPAVLVVDLQRSPSADHMGQQNPTSPWRPQMLSPSAAATEASVARNAQLQQGHAVGLASPSVTPIDRTHQRESAARPAAVVVTLGNSPQRRTVSSPYRRQLILSP